VRGHLRQAAALWAAPLRGALRDPLPGEVPPPGHQRVRVRVHVEDLALFRNFQVEPC